MAEIKVLTNSGIETQALPLQDSFFQPFLPGLKYNFPPELPIGIPDNIIAEDIADNLTSATYQQLPVNIDRVLVYCGITTTTYHNDLRVKGSINRATEGDDFSIKVRSGQHPTEIAMTKGHELGHVILHHAGIKLEKYNEYFKRRETDTEKEWVNRILECRRVERFCENFARMVLGPRHLLLPRLEQIKDRNFICSDYSPRGSTLFLNEEIIELFEEVQLPPHDFAWRVADLGLGDKNFYTLEVLLTKYQMERNH